MSTYNRNKEIKTDVIEYMNELKAKRRAEELEQAKLLAEEQIKCKAERKDNIYMIITVLVVLAIIIFGRRPIAELILLIGGLM